MTILQLRDTYFPNSKIKTMANTQCRATTSTYWRSSILGRGQLVGRPTEVKALIAHRLQSQHSPLLPQVGTLIHRRARLAGEEWNLRSM